MRKGRLVVRERNERGEDKTFSQLILAVVIALDLGILLFEPIVSDGVLGPDPVVRNLHERDGPLDGLKTSLLCGGDDCRLLGGQVGVARREGRRCRRRGGRNRASVERQEQLAVSKFSLTKKT